MNKTNFSSSTLNRKIRMRDTFTKIFPSYVHGEGTVCRIPSTTHETYMYPEKSIEGKPMH